MQRYTFLVLYNFQKAFMLILSNLPTILWEWVLMFAHFIETKQNQLGSLEALSGKQSLQKRCLPLPSPLLTAILCNPWQFMLGLLSLSETTPSNEQYSIPTTSLWKSFSPYLPRVSPALDFVGYTLLGFWDTTLLGFFSCLTSCPFKDLTSSKSFPTGRKQRDTDCFTQMVPGSTEPPS